MNNFPGPVGRNLHPQKMANAVFCHFFCRSLAVCDVITS